MSESGAPGERRVHRSKSVVERNLPRWFRKPGFKAWDDFLDFFRRGGGGGADEALIQEFQELDQKGDDATPRILGKLIKFYNRQRKFSKTEVAPPWLFVEAPPANVPADDVWTIQTATDMDHERSEKGPAKPAPAKPATGKHVLEKDRKDAAVPAEAPAASADAAGQSAGKPDGEAAAPVEPAEAARPSHDAVVPPPTTDRTWCEALKRLPQTVQILVDGRGKNVSELNDRRRRALDLAQVDRAHGLGKHGGELRAALLHWILEKKRDAKQIEAEIKQRLSEIDGWVDRHMEAALAKLPGTDEHTRNELRTRVRRIFPKEPDEQMLSRMARSSFDASRPKRRETWARKVLDDFNNSRGSAAEKVRDPWLVDGIIQWLSGRRDDDVPTDGDIYDYIQKLGGPNMAARKRRQEGPRPPRPPEKTLPRDDDDEEEEKPAKGAAAKPK